MTAASHPEARQAACHLADMVGKQAKVSRSREGKAELEFYPCQWVLKAGQAKSPHVLLCAQA